jgi:hypothetical protein
MIAGPASGRAVPARARELAARLGVLFGRDVEIIERLGDAQRRLRVANERLSSGLAPDAIGVTPAGKGQILKLMSDALSGGGPGSEAAVLRALGEIHWRVHHAFCQYQRACEERRQLAFDVGELSHQLTEVLCAAGWTAQQARAADVHELSGARVR